MTTIKDVARTAGVSTATVSRVYNNSPAVRPATRDHVRQVAQRLGYSPHGAARSLITKRTHAIGVLLPDLYGEFFSELIRGIDEAARERGYHVLLSSGRSAGATFHTAFPSMRGRVDGLIVMAPAMDFDASYIGAPISRATVLLCCPPNDAPFDTVAIANFDGARAMVRHLASLGHRRIAMIRGAEGNFDAAERLRAYRAALAETGLDANPQWELPGDFSEAAGHVAARQMIALAPRPTALFAANDCMAIGAMSALRDAGLRVPEDVAIGGFDDIPMARYMEPALTSVHIDIGALGRLAMTCVLDALDQSAPRSPRRETLAATLVVRRSCGAPFASPPHKPSTPHSRK